MSLLPLTVQSSEESSTSLSALMEALASTKLRLVGQISNMLCALDEKEESREEGFGEGDTQSGEGVAGGLNVE